MPNKLSYSLGSTDDAIEEARPMLQRPRQAQTSIIWRHVSVLSVVCLIGLLPVLFIQQRMIMTQTQCLAQTSTTTFTTKYVRDRRYMTLEHEYDTLWAGWEDGAQIVVPDETTGETVPAAISMYHQMHCLRSLRTALQSAYYGAPVALDWHENAHWPHCLDYLRLSVLCFADDTVERPVLDANGTRLHQIDGMQEVRQCRSMQRVDQLLDEHGLHS